MYLASKNGKTFRVNGVQVAVFKNAGYTITEEAKAKTKAKAKPKATEDTETTEEA